LNSFCEGEVSVGNQCLRVTWNVKTIQLLQLVLNLFFSHIEIDWDYSGTRTLKELNVRCFNELFGWEWIDNIFRELGLVLSLFKYFILSSDKFLLPFSMLGHRLR
jgi:hypothetical protein